MRKRLLAVFVIVIMLSLIGCSNSAMDKVTITNVEQESYRPEGYDGPTGIEGGFNWDGILISGDITNNSNETLYVVVVINSYVDGKTKMYNRYGQSNVVTLGPGEIKRFEYDFNYDEQDVDAAWTHDISDVVKK